MISKKYINVIVSILMVISLCLSSVLVLLSNDISTSSAKKIDYVTTIFNKDTEIDINNNFSMNKEIETNSNNNFILILYGICLITLLLSILFAILFKERHFLS
jgi:hypothetical protein